jgi:hypothetical protein
MVSFEALSYNFTFRYEDDVLSLNNSVDRIYPIENEIKDTTERDSSGSYLDVHLADRSHTLSNMVSFAGYIFHMHVLLQWCYASIESSQWEN